MVCLRQTELYPYIIKILKNWKLKDFKQEREDLIFGNFSELFQRTKQNGHAPEEM